jgi:hypothetical protein
LVLYHAASHGLVSVQRPAGYIGPAGGMLCDEMGELYWDRYTRDFFCHTCEHRRMGGGPALFTQ